MTSDPKECRRRALTCIKLAEATASREDRAILTKLAKAWLTLAGDLDASEARGNVEYDDLKRTGGIARDANPERSRLRPVAAVRE
jgi:hypothetical protein